MMRRSLATAVFVAVGVAWASVVVPAAAQLDLVLIHANDAHSHFDEMDVYGNECGQVDAATDRCYGGFARMAQFVADEKRAARDRGVPALFLMAGDIFQGTPYFSLFKWKPVAEFVNRLRPDVRTLGNHEFDEGIDSLSLYLNETKNIPVVISNLNTTAEPDMSKFLSTSLTFTLNNTKVGIVGYLSTNTPKMSKTGTVGFLDEIESLKTETKKLRESGVNIIIALGHSGIEKDQIIAKEVEDIDLIVGGHSHTFLYSGKPPSVEKPYGPYPLYVKNFNNKTVPILQAYSISKYVGKVYLKFDCNGHLIEITGSPIIMDHKITQDPSMLTIVDQWKLIISKYINFTIGRTAVKLLIDDCFYGECNIGNLIADSFINYNVMIRNIYDKYWTDAPIAIVGSAGIRASITGTNNYGQITMGQLINAMPFMNTLVKITISGYSLLEAFEYSVFNYIMTDGRPKLMLQLLQVSGVMVEFDMTQSPGYRVSSLFLRCGRCSVPKFEPLVLTANYTVITNNFLAEGGDNFVQFTKRLKDNEVLNVKDYNATATYIQLISPITTGIEGRIKFKSNNSDQLHKA